VQNYPSLRQRGRSGHGLGMSLLGLYEGIPLSQRGEGYNLVIPDRITIFQRPIEHLCHADHEVVEEVRRVVQHEIGHHFGLSDARLEELESQRRQREAASE
ncbi:MAG: metallopeptidase family protein, partial [Dehalococcoidia bacterium]|nr:metallopeptidase family protein [Dehalococcoidia bacterium]